MTDGVLVRSRLLELLDRKDRRVCVITAPSGFGKTTLLRNWASAQEAQAEGAAIWVALSSELTTRHAFWERVVASARRHGHLDAGTSAALINHIEAVEDPVPVMAQFLDGLGPAILMLDAYENLRELTSAIDEDILRLTERIPELRVIVTTRAVTQLTDDVLALHGRAQTIAESQLQFTPAETELLLSEHAPHVDRPTAARVHRETHGYPLAVRAVAFALARRSSMPLDGSAEWRALATADLKSQLAEPAMIEFLLATCIPPYFDAELAGSLSGGADSDKLLAELQWHGFGRWIPYAPNRPAFQYVESVRDMFLSELMATDPPRYAQGAADSALWLYQNDDHEVALDLAIDAGEFGLAATITRSLIITSPESYTTDRLESSLRRVPKSVLPRYPILALALGLAHLANPATRGSAGEYFRITAVHGTDDLRGMTHAEIFFQHGIQAVSLRFIGHFQESGAAASRALTYYDAMSVEQHDVLAEFTPLAFRQLAYSLFQAGDVDHATSVISRALTSATTEWSKNYTLAYGVGIHAIAGNTPQTRATLDMVNPDSWPRDHELSYMNGLGVIGKAALRLDEFDFTGALDHLAESDAYVQTAEFWPFLTWVSMNARLGLGEAGTEAYRVEEALNSAPAPPGIGANLGTVAVQNMLAILWLAAGHRAKASALLDAPAEGSPAQLAPARILYLLVSGEAGTALAELPRAIQLGGHTIRSRSAVFTLGAVAALRERNEDTTLRLLHRATALFQTYGSRAHLMYIPAADLAGLRSLATKGGNQASVDYLAGQLASALPQSSIGPMLTMAERAVLQAFLGNRTQLAVARALYLSPNTIKSHLRSIYQKLGVNSRAGAIQRATELDLLEPPE